MFAGAGGASNGLVRACRQVRVELDLLAINHWPTAVQTHTLNHPQVRHLCEAVERVEPLQQVPGGHLHVLLAGPECTHFSTARGGRPVNPQSRASAWHILKWAQELYINTILIENVPEFRTWGPIGVNGKPLKSKKGQTYRAFLEALRSLGYRVEEKILNAADYGDPTTRQRLFIIARRGRHAVRWPIPSHSKTGQPSLFGKTKRWTPAREIIDWSVQGRSIFNRKKPLRPATLARILAGLEKFGGPDLQPFLVVLRNHAAGRSLDDPAPPVLAGGTHLGLAQPFVIPVNHGAEELRSRSVDEPLPTLTGRANQYLVEPFVLAQASGGVARPVSAPIPTVATKGAVSLIEPFIVPHRRSLESTPADSIDEPLRTITAAAGRCFGLAEPFLVPYNGTAKEARVHSVDEPLRTQTTENRFGVAEPFIVPFLGERHGQEPRVKSLDDPLQTITTRNPIGLAEPFLTKYNRTAVGAYSVDEPIDTISTRDRFGLVQPVINGMVLDINFRMLQPHELAAAMSFPKSYVFHGTREEVVKQIGNAWAGELSYALSLELVKDYAPKAKRRRPAA